MLALGLLLQVLRLDKGQESFFQASSSYLQAPGVLLFQNLQNLQPFEFPLIVSAPWFHVGYPIGQGSQRKLWFMLQSIP